MSWDTQSFPKEDQLPVDELDLGIVGTQSSAKARSEDSAKAARV
jgi:hypothetical protein